MTDTQTGIKVLIVDDDSFLLDIYSVKFKEHGMESQVSLSGQDALKILRDGFKPDIIILDLIMPTMDGFAILETARKEKLINGVTVIVLSNQSSAKDKDLAKAADVDGYIVKASATPSEVFDEVLKIYKAREQK
jgi:CheY-like chemotaxis protein